MKKTLKIFDYFKTAFHINKENKLLYRPQLILILLKLLVVIVVGTQVYSIVNSIGSSIVNNPFYTPNAWNILMMILKGLGWVFFVALLSSIGSTVIEAGLYNMYKACVTSGTCSMKDFSEGIHTYTLKFILIDILTGVTFAVASPLLLLLGIIAFFIGGALLTFALNVFLIMWKISMVMDGTGVFASLNSSFSFASHNFVALVVLQIINHSFTKGAASAVSNPPFFTTTFKDLVSTPEKTPVPNYPPFGNLPVQPPYMPPDLHQVFSVVNTIMLVLIPVISLSTIISSLIGMIFKVFFSLSLFIAYRDGFNISETTEPKPEDSKEEAICGLID